MFAQGVDNGEEQVKYNNMEGDNRKKKCIIGGTIVALIAVLAVIIVVATGGGEKDQDQDPDDPADLTCYNPMCTVFATKPNFEEYTFENTNKNYETEFWADEIFGGPITEPLWRKNEEDLENPIEVPNAMIADLKKNWADRGEYSGYFML